MAILTMLKGLTALFFVSSWISTAAGQTGATLTTPPITNATRSSTPTVTTDTATSSAPDVYLNVPTLSVGEIQLIVEDLSADINLAANVAQLVTINAGVQVGITKVNLTITDVDAQLELVVRLGHLVDIVNRVFQSLDLNPLLINTLNDVTGVLDEVVGQVDGLLGSITQGGTTLSFVVDNLGNIVQEVGGVSTIVGNYLNNMTYTGESQSLGNGLVQKTYSYAPLNALVNIVFNTAGQIVQATVAKVSGGSGSSSTVTSSTVAAPSSTATSSKVTTTSSAATSSKAAASSTATPLNRSTST